MTEVNRPVEPTTLIEAIRTAAGPSLGQQKLEGLGRINVICGPNNSGKSTLLNIIAAGADAGISSDMLRERVRAPVAQMAGARAPSSLQTLVHGALDRSVEASGYWYEQDAKTWAQILKREGSQIPQIRHIRPDNLKATYTQSWPTLPTRLVIPAKRQLLVKDVRPAGNTQPESNGDNVVSYLHFLRSQVRDVALEEQYTSIREAFAEITDGFELQLHLNHDGTVDLGFSRTGTRWIDARKIGLGMRDLLIILTVAHTSAAQWILIEEPENHLHPDYQRRLAHHLRERINKQFIVTTHSNVFLNPTVVDRVFRTAYQGGAIVVSDATSRSAALSDLGYSIADNLTSELLVLVEGPSDVPVLQELLRKRNLLPQFDIKLWALGGDIMDQLDLSVFNQGYHTVAIVDRDPGSARSRKRFVENCEHAGIDVTRLKRRAIENYFSLDALREVFVGRIPESLTSLDDQQRLEQQIGFSVKRSNRKLARALKLEDIEGTDLDEFLDKVETILHSVSVAS